MPRRVDVEQIRSSHVVRAQEDEVFGYRLVNLITYWTKYQDAIFLFNAYPQFVDHGMPHSMNVAEIFVDIVESIPAEHALNGAELFLGACACFLHDVGMFPEEERPGPFERVRREHGRLSACRIRQQNLELFYLLEQEADLVGAIAAHHQSHSGLSDLPSSAGFTDLWGRQWQVRVRLLAALLSLADVCDKGERRFDGIESNRAEVTDGRASRRLDALMRGAEETFDGELEDIRALRKSLHIDTPHHFAVHRAVRSVVVDANTNTINIEPARIPSNPDEQQVQENLLRFAQEDVAKELDRSGGVLEEEAGMLITTVIVGHQQVHPRPVRHSPFRRTAYQEVPGLLAVNRQLKERAEEGAAPHLLVGVSNGGTLAASLLSRWSNIPAGSVVRCNPRVQTLTGGHDVPNSRIIAATQLSRLRTHYELDGPLRIALVEDVCRSGRSVRAAAEHLRSQEVPMCIDTVLLVEGAAIGYTVARKDLRMGDGDGELIIGEKEGDTTITMPWEDPEAILRLSGEDEGLVAQLETYFTVEGRPGALVGVSGGGTILACYLSQYFNIPVACLTRSNPQVEWLLGGHRPEESEIISWPDYEDICDPGDFLLFVDDAARSGGTMRRVLGKRQDMGLDDSHGVHLDIAVYRLGRSLAGDAVCKYYRELTQLGCRSFFYDEVEARPGTHLPWDARPELDTDGEGIS